MKKFALALAAIFVLSIACGGGETPDQVINKLMDGVQSGDGDVIISCLSAEVITGINEGLEELKADAEGTASMAVMMGITITAEEVADLTPGKALSIMLSSEMVASQMPDFSTVVIGEAVVDGDVAMVPVTLDGDTEDMELVLEDGKWKIGGEGMDFM